MNRTYTVMLILVSLVIGSIGRGVVADPQTRNLHKYAYVIGKGDQAFICYAESTGVAWSPSQPSR